MNPVRRCLECGQMFVLSNEDLACGDEFGDLTTLCPSCWNQEFCDAPCEMCNNQDCTKREATYNPDLLEPLERPVDEPVPASEFPCLKASFETYCRHHGMSEEKIAEEWAKMEKDLEKEDSHEDA